MIEFIKKVLVRHQAKQAQCRIDNNRKNIKLILQGLEQRGY